MLIDTKLIFLCCRYRGTGEVQTGEKERKKQNRSNKMQADIYFKTILFLLNNFSRQRKLERIAQLDSEVTQLKEENMSLSQMKEELLRESKGFSMVRIMLYIFPLVVIFALAVIGV